MLEPQSVHTCPRCTLGLKKQDSADGVCTLRNMCYNQKVGEIGQCQVLPVGAPDLWQGPRSFYFPLSASHRPLRRALLMASAVLGILAGNDIQDRKKSSSSLVQLLESKDSLPRSASCNSPSHLFSNNCIALPRHCPELSFGKVRPIDKQTG